MLCSAYTEALEIVCLRALDPCSRALKVHTSRWSGGRARSSCWVQAAMLYTASANATINILRLEPLYPCSWAGVGGAGWVPAASMLSATFGRAHNVLRMRLCKPRRHTLERRTNLPSCRRARGCCWVQAAMFCSAGAVALEVICLRALDPCDWAHKVHTSWWSGCRAGSCCWVQAAMLRSAGAPEALEVICLWALDP